MVSELRKAINYSRLILNSNFFQLSWRNKIVKFSRECANVASKNNAKNAAVDDRARIMS